MQRFSFSQKEIDTFKTTKKEWHNFVRRREAEMAFSLFPNTKYPLALELGAGDGGQSVTIAKYCEHLVCTELDEKSHSWLGQKILDRNLQNVEYRLCDAQNLLEYGDKTFNLIFSSNLLEHVPNINRCLSECKRVLKDDGVMLHTMPNRWWKIFSYLLSIAKIQIPSVHGVSANHIAEFYNFGRNVWNNRFVLNGFYVEKVVAFPFYVGHGNSFIFFIKLGNLIYLPASYLYISRKISSN